MKRGLPLVVCFLAAIFLASSMDDGYAWKVSYGKKLTGDKKILRDLRSNVLNVAIPAIQKVERKEMKEKKNLRRAAKTLMRLVRNKRKHPSIRIAAANALSTLKVSKARKVLRREIGREKNVSVKNAFIGAYNRLVGRVEIKPSYAGTPGFVGTPGYAGTPGYHGTPRFLGSPSYRGTPGYPGTRSGR